MCALLMYGKGSHHLPSCFLAFKFTSSQALLWEGVFVLLCIVGPLVTFGKASFVWGEWTVSS